MCFFRNDQFCLISKMVPRLILILSIILLNFALSNDILKSSTSPLIRLQQFSENGDTNVLNFVLNESLRNVNNNSHYEVLNFPYVVNSVILNQQYFEGDTTDEGMDNFKDFIIFLRDGDLLYNIG